MKNLKAYLILISINVLIYGSTFGIIFLTTSCETEPYYPEYKLVIIEEVPDSLAVEYRAWITNTISAASYHMTGGDYEDADATIRQAKWTADEMFTEQVEGLRITIAEYEHYEIPYHDLNEYERKIFDLLRDEKKNYNLKNK